MGLIGFVMAMRVVKTIAADDPSNPVFPTPAWLILSRWGARGECLTISEAAPVAARGFDAEAPHAPQDLMPQVTWFGELALAAEESDPVFLLTRVLPPHILVAGCFEPADGFARLGADADGALRLSLLARRPAPDAAAGQPHRIWHLAAEQCPWIGECLDASADPGP